LDLTGNDYDLGEPVLHFGLPGAQPVSGDWNENMQINVAIQLGSNLQLEVTLFKPNGSPKLATRMVTTTSRIGL
jgi:hypothetical protein